MGSALLAEVRDFLKSNWVQFLLIFPGVFWVNAIHEGAHAAAVLLQGGSIVEFSIIPNVHDWGSVVYRSSGRDDFSNFAVSMAPYAVWMSIALASVIFSFRRAPFPFWIASMLFVWAFVMPLGDIAYAVFPYLLGGQTDFKFAFGQSALLSWILAAFGLSVSCWIGYGVQRRFYRQRALSIAAYGIMCAATIILLAGLSI